MNKKHVLLCASLLAVSVISTAVFAMRPNEVEFIYLDSKGKIVGVKTYHCAGGITQWGTTTPIVQKYSTPCD